MKHRTSGPCRLATRPLLVLLLVHVEAQALDVWVNQAGYEPNAPKTTRVQRSSDFAGDGTFSVVRVSDGSSVYSGPLQRKGPLWDRWYWEGDFSPLRALGEFRITATIDGEVGTSYDFTIGNQFLLNRTGTLAVEYFWTQRCGVAVPGWHGVCHSDDGLRRDTFQHMNAVGGWHDAGDYGKFPHGFAGDGLFALLWLYEQYPDYYNAIDRNGDGIPDIIDEALHQARWLAKMIDPDGHVLQQIVMRRSGSSFVRPEQDTDNIVGTFDDRWVDRGNENTPQEMMVCAALIRTHRVLASLNLPTENFASKALSIWDHRVELAIAQGGHNNLGHGAMQVFAGLDLHAVTGQQNCHDRAVQRIAEFASTTLANPGFYDGMHLAEAPGYELGVMAWFAREYPDAPPSNNARAAVAALMNRNMNVLASPTIGLVRRDENGTLEYFPTNPNNNAFFLGLNRLYLLLTWGAIEAHKTLNNPDYLRFAQDQYDWVMGGNYFRVCMMHDAGTFHARGYHHRYYRIPGHEDGSQPGVVPNGYVRTYSTGLPQFDLTSNQEGGLARYQTNEGWLINNAGYAMALAGMTVFQDDAAHVSDTIPAAMTAGLSYSVSVTMKNTSYVPWDSDNYFLGAVDDSDPFTDGRHALPPGTVVQPDDSHTWTFTMTAPTTPGMYTTDWRMVQEHVNWFGETLVREVEVLSTAPPAPVSQFTAVADVGSVTLHWTNPSTPNFSGTMIRWSTQAPPASPAEGTLLIDKPASPSSTDSTVHTGLTAGNQYYYSAFAHNDVPAYAVPATLAAAPLSIADLDRDGDVDQSDFGILQGCFSGDTIPYPPGCQAADLDGDGDVDGLDFNLMFPCMNGPNRLPGC